MQQGCKPPGCLILEATMDFRACAEPTLLPLYHREVVMILRSISRPSWRQSLSAAAQCSPELQTLMATPNAQPTQSRMRTTQSLVQLHLSMYSYAAQHLKQMNGPTHAAAKVQDSHACKPAQTPPSAANQHSAVARQGGLLHQT